MKPTATAEQEPAVLDPESRLIELRRLSAEDPAGRWFLPLGALLLELDLVTEAQRTVRQGLAADPDCLSGWVLLGRSYWMGGEAAAARRIMASVLARDPENAHALRVRAQAEMHLGESGAAIRDYRALLRLVPGDLAAQDALAQLLDHENGGQAGEHVQAPVLSAKHEDVSMPLAAALAPTSGPAPKRGSLKRARQTQAQPPPKPVKSGARRRAVAAPSERAVLPPAPRPKAGIFESPPADLDWRRAEASPPSVPERKPQPPAAPDPERARRGYQRWLDKLVADQERGQSRKPDVGAEP